MSDDKKISMIYQQGSLAGDLRLLCTNLGDGILCVLYSITKP